MRKFYLPHQGRHFEQKKLGVKIVEKATFLTKELDFEGGVRRFATAQKVPFTKLQNNLQYQSCARSCVIFFSEQVSRQKHLRRVIFVDEIPKNSTGKIIRGTLRELLTPKSSL